MLELLLVLVVDITLASQPALYHLCKPILHLFKDGQEQGPQRLQKRIFLRLSSWRFLDRDQILMLLLQELDQGPVLGLELLSCECNVVDTLKQVKARFHESLIVEHPFALLTRVRVDRRVAVKRALYGVAELDAKLVNSHHSCCVTLATSLVAGR